MNGLSRLPFAVKAALALAALLLIGVLARGAAQWWGAPASGPVKVAVDTVINTQIEDDLAWVGSSLVLEREAAVAGDAALLGASIVVRGRVDNDLTAMGDSIVLAEGSQIDGDAAINGRTVTVAGAIAGDLLVTAETLIVAPGAEIGGAVYPCVPAAALSLDARLDVHPCDAARQAQLFAPVQELQPAAAPPPQDSGVSLAAGIAGALAFGLVLAGLSVMLVAALPDRLRVIRIVARERTMESISTFVAVVLLGVGIAALQALLLALATPLGVAMLPVAAGLGVAFVMVLLVGLVNAVVSLGLAVGERIAPAHPALVTVLLGSGLVALAPLVMAVAPVLSPAAALALVLLAAPGAGAALLSRMGSRGPRRATFVQG